MWNDLQRFYTSDEWRNLREVIISDRTPLCEECGKLIKESKHIIIHHIKELTLANVNDYNISLNPDNLKLVCFNCHNKIHERFGHHRFIRKSDRGIYIVYGPPFSGKSTYVKENMIKGDLVIDLDKIYEAISYQELYDKPENLKYNLFAIRNTLIDNIKTRHGHFKSAWIVGGYAAKFNREKLAKDLGAELIYIEASKEDCLDRLEYCNDYRRTKKENWKQYIEEWFEDYQE